jgi:hypothetical protein
MLSEVTPPGLHDGERFLTKALIEQRLILEANACWHTPAARLKQLPQS